MTYETTDMPISSYHEVESFGQFALGFGNCDLPSSFATYGLGNLHVGVHETLNVANIFDKTGNGVGILIGQLISLKENKIINKLEVDCDYGTDQFWQELEGVFYEAHGRYVAVLYNEGKGRVYLDANGILSLVYSEEKRSAASSALLILGDEGYRERFTAGLFNRLDVLGEGWFPSGLTAHVGLRRLLCNHYLELPAFKAVRHWPKAEFAAAGDPVASAEEVVSRTAQAIGILVNEGRVAASLTGGNETRFILACARKHIGDIAFFTVDGPTSQRDVSIAKTLTARFGLRHRVLPCRVATPEQQAAWLLRVSHTVGGTNRLYHPSVWALADVADFSIGGLGGEIGRAFFWRATDTMTMELSARDIVARFGMPIESDVVEATETWAATVTAFNPLTRLDLAYLELRMSAWAFAQSYAQPVQFRPLHPMISRRIYDLMLSQSPAAKRGNWLLRAGIRLAWPELLDVPINKYGDARDIAAFLRAAASLKRIRKKLIKRFG